MSKSPWFKVVAFCTLNHVLEQILGLLVTFAGRGLLFHALRDDGYEKLFGASEVEVGDP